RKAAMILSRSPAGAPAAAAGRRGERLEDLRVDRRAMTTLLRGMRAACSIARLCEHPDFSLKMYAVPRTVPRCALPRKRGRRDKRKRPLKPTFGRRRSAKASGSPGQLARACRCGGDRLAH